MSASKACGEDDPSADVIIPDGTAVKTVIDAKTAVSNNGNYKKMMTNLPKRPPALIEYSDLTYTVYERSEFIIW